VRGPRGEAFDRRHPGPGDRCRPTDPHAVDDLETPRRTLSGTVVDAQAGRLPDHDGEIPLLLRVGRRALDPGGRAGVQGDEALLGLDLRGDLEGAVGARDGLRRDARSIEILHVPARDEEHARAGDGSPRGGHDVAAKGSGGIEHEIDGALRTAALDDDVFRRGRGESHRCRGEVVGAVGNRLERERPVGTGARGQRVLGPGAGELDRGARDRPAVPIADRPGDDGSSRDLDRERRGGDRKPALPDGNEALGPDLRRDRRRPGKSDEIDAPRVVRRPLGAQH